MKNTFRGRCDEQLLQAGRVDPRAREPEKQLAATVGPCTAETQWEDCATWWDSAFSVLSKTPRQKWTWSLCFKNGFEPRSFEMATTAHHLRLHPPVRDGAPADIISHYALDAMLDTIHVEKIEGYAIQCCELPGCLRTFQRRTGHKMLYCTPEHASLATTRRWRRKGRRLRNRNDRVKGA